VFSDYRLGRLVVASLRFLHDRGDVQSLAFVVMPDHLRWLFVLQGPRPLDRVVAALKRESAREINRRLGRSGRCLWQAGYFDRAIRDDEDLQAIARYIVANPLRAGLCASVRDYPLWDAVWT
jgi:REP element-mobilizing transposase RayT